MKRQNTLQKKFKKPKDQRKTQSPSDLANGARGDLALILPDTGANTPNTGSRLLLEDLPELETLVGSYRKVSREIRMTELGTYYNLPAVANI